MYAPLTCVIVDSDAANREELAGFLKQHGATPGQQLGGIDPLAETLGRPDPPSLAIVNLDPDPTESLKKIAALQCRFPAVAFFVMSKTVDSTLLIEAMHVGVREFIPLPVSEQRFSAALERVAQSQGMGKKARIIHVVPMAGGCGSTTIACNLAAALGRTSKTVILDLDLMRGGVASYFDARARYNLADVVDNIDKLDQQLLDNALAFHESSRVSILARPELPEDTRRVNQAGVVRLLGVLGRLFDFVVIDSLMSISSMYAAVLQAADLNLLVTQLNVPSAKNAERFMGTMRRMGIDATKMMLVANRFDKRSGDLEPAELERSMGLKVGWLVPNDFKNAIAAINYGEPVVIRAPKSEMGKSLIRLAGALIESPARTEAA